MKRFLSFFILLLIIIAIIIYFLARQAAEPSLAPAAETESAEEIFSTVSEEDVRALIVENANLIVQAGRIGIEVMSNNDWRSRGTQAAALVGEGKYVEAAVILRQLNADIRAAIEEK